VKLLGPGFASRRARRDRRSYQVTNDLHVRIEGERDLAKQIYEQVRGAILAGRLAPGERLPPTRELARRLDVSRNTVSLAYEWLTAQGLLRGRAGAGSFVDATGRSNVRQRPSPPPSTMQSRRLWSQIPRDFGKIAPGAFDFRPGVPDTSLFPFRSWRRLVSKQLTPRRSKDWYEDSTGHPALREAIAKYVGVARGVPASADDVMVTCGTQHGLDLLGRVLIEPGTRVAIEDPTYPPMRQLFESLGADVVGVEVDDEGLSVASLPDDARLVYVTPSHQYPLCVQMSHARRLALLRWAQERNAVLIEDDCDSDFRFAGRPADPLKAMDRAGCVVYVGEFRKTMLPSLRLGFLLAPASVQEALKTALFVGGCHCPCPTQAAMAEFIRDGLFARHIRKMRREYAGRRDKVMQTLERRFGQWLDPIHGATGLHVTAFLRTSLEIETTIAACAEGNGISLHRLSPYYLRHRARPGLTLGYGGVSTERIEEGLQRLRNSIEHATAARRARS
jgi:GntR family transcriptional regulator / MocR family aminotransferase